MPDSFFYLNKAGPIHASNYLSTDQVLLASGAGPSKTGQKNRIAAYSLAKSLETSAKSTERSGVVIGGTILGDDEDAPSSFARHNDLLIAGVNESLASRKESGDNHHLRTFRITRSTDDKGDSVAIKKSLQHQIFEHLSIERDEYQKITKLSPDGKYAGLISSDGLPAVVDMSNMAQIHIGTDTAKWVDLEFTKDMLWIATTHGVQSFSLPTGDESSISFSLSHSSVPKAHQLTALRVLGTDSLLLGLNHTSSNSSYLATYKVHNNTLVQRKVAYLSSKLRGIYLNVASSSQRIMATTSDGQAILYDSELEKLKTWKGLHQFPISTVSLRNDGMQAITCSIDEKVNILDLEDLRGSLNFGLQVLCLLLFMVIYLIYHLRKGS